MTTNRGSCLLGAVLGSALVLTLAPTAMAADIYEAPLKGGYDVPPPPPSNRAIYMKGYVGQANPNVGNVFAPGFERLPVTIFHNEIKSSPLFGIGVGWQVRHWLRFDGTIEYRGDSTFFAADRVPNAGLPTGLQTNEYTADISSWLGLVNAYWDICTWRGITPYVGAGIGFASLSIDGFKDVNVPANGVAFGTGHTSTNFAWAFHAGLSYDVSPQFVVDLAYRYADLGDVRTGPVTAYTGVFAYNAFHVRDISSNDVMLGFRYKLQHDEPAYMIK